MNYTWPLRVLYHRLTLPLSVSSLQFTNHNISNDGYHTFFFQPNTCELHVSTIITKTKVVTKGRCSSLGWGTNVICKAALQKASFFSYLFLCSAFCGIFVFVCFVCFRCFIYVSFSCLLYTEIAAVDHLMDVHDIMSVLMEKHWPVTNFASLHHAISCERMSRLAEEQKWKRCWFVFAKHLLWTQRLEDLITFSCSDDLQEIHGRWVNTAGCLRFIAGLWIPKWKWVQRRSCDRE